MARNTKRSEITFGTLVFELFIDDIRVLYSLDLKTGVWTDSLTTTEYLPDSERAQLINEQLRQVPGIDINLLQRPNRPERERRSHDDLI